MIAAAGMIAQELASNQKLFMLSVGGQEATIDGEASKKFDGEAYAKELPGVLPPMGFFDPLGFCSADDITEGKIKFYREVELKHGRVGMLAALGFLVGENFHPLFGGDIDVPAYLAFQQTPLQTFWPAVVFAIAIPEIYSVFSFKTPALFAQKGEEGGMPWEIRSDFASGDLGFDPLGLKPTDPEELKQMQTKELQNGRLAMIAAAGMIAQELASNQKLFMLAVGGQEEEKEEAPAAPAPFNGVEYAKSLPGVTGPLGFFDPLGFCSADDITEGKIRFYREVELKHGRVGMLAALGFVVGENFHPLFGGNIDVPSYLAFQETPLQTFWPAVVFAIAIPEIFSVFSFETPALFAGPLAKKGGMVWSIRSDFESGDLGFDPLGLKPTDPAELLAMQNKELNNGRLAMIAAAGMIVQELATGEKLF